MDELNLKERRFGARAVLRRAEVMCEFVSTENTCFASTSRRFKSCTGLGDMNDDLPLNSRGTVDRMDHSQIYRRNDMRTALSSYRATR